MSKRDTSQRKTSQPKTGQDKTAKRRNGLTYAEAGVDIDAGNLMVE